LDAASGCNRNAIVVGLRPIGVTVAVVNGIHQTSLRGRIAGRHREIGITTQISQYSNLIVKATAPAVWPRIVQGPVSVDESEGQLPIALAKQTMLAVQYAAKTAYAVDKVLATFAIMMKVDLHVGYPVANHFRQRLYQGRMIFLFRKKERISRSVANRIHLASPGNLWPSCPPKSDA
jgi:hypothetical protein